VTSRLGIRARILARAAAGRLAARRRAAVADPRNILVVSTLLIGDALLLAPLLAKLRLRHPGAAIRMTASRHAAALFAGRPYGVEVRPFDPRDAGSLSALSAWPAPDLALVPGDNRNSWLAAALGARWIVAFSGDRPSHKNWMVDELVAWPERPGAWSDIAATLVAGSAPPPYRPDVWPAPVAADFERPAGRYAVLHVEASTPLKQWEDSKWLALAETLAAGGLAPLWSAGPRGEPQLRRIDPKGRFSALGHRLDLAQLWHLVAGAALLVCPDTSVMHIGRLTGTPTIGLFGPTSATLYGPGEFWREAPFRGVTVDNFPCRDQDTLFKRRIEWIRTCRRTTAECPAPRCLHALGVDAVMRAVRELV